MNNIGFVQYGMMSEYQDEISKNGCGHTFKKGEDLVPYLTKNNSMFYIDTGIVYLRLCKPDGTYSQLMAFRPGIILPFIGLEKEFPFSNFQMLVAARRDVTGIVFSKDYFEKKKRSDYRFSDLIEKQWLRSLEYLYVSQLLYREGDGITRISNLLYHVYRYKDHDSEIFQIGQEELAYTVNISVSQAKRALSQLRKEGAIEIKYEKIVIKNISLVASHISDALRVGEITKEKRE